MIYRFTINSINYDVTLINETSSTLTFAPIDENFVSITSFMEEVVVNKSKFQNVGINDFSTTIQRYGSGTLNIIENDVSIGVFLISAKQIKYNEWDNTYSISLKTPNKQNYEANKSLDYNIINTTLNRIPLDAEGYEGSIADWFSAYDVVELLINKMYLDYSFSSTFFTEINMYVCQSSNVIKAATTSLYNSATIFDLGFQKLFNDLVVIFNLRIKIEGATVRIEPYSTFENERLITTVGFDALSSDYEGYLQTQEEYFFDDIDTVKREEYTNTFDTFIFKNRNVDYNNEGSSIEYSIAGYTDMTGVLTQPSNYANTSWFYCISDDGLNVNKSTSIFPSVSEFDYTNASLQYSGIDNNNNVITRSDPLPGAEIAGNSDLEIASDLFSVDAGAIVKTNFMFDGYINRAYVLNNATLSNSTANKLSITYSIFVADSTLKTDTNDWSNCSISNTVSGNNKGAYVRNSFGELILYPFLDGLFYKASTLTPTSPTTELITIGSSSPSYASAIVIAKIKLGTTRTDSNFLGELPQYINTKLTTSINGTFTYLNEDLAFLNTVPNYQFNDMYEDVWEFEDVTYSDGSKTKRTKKGQSVLSIDNVADFDYSTFILTQFGTGEIENANINLFTNQLTINGKYSGIVTGSESNNIISFDYPGLKTVSIFDDIIISEAVIGTDLSLITPTITVSPYATYSEITTDYSDNVTIQVTSESGVIKEYTVIVTIGKPRFQFSGTTIFGSASPFTTQQWVRNEGTVYTGVNFTIFTPTVTTAGSIILDNDDIDLITDVIFQGLTNLVDFTGFTSLNNVLLTSCISPSIILPDLNYNQISLSSCQLTEFDLIQFTDLNNTTIVLTSNSLDPNIPLFQIDNKGWINGSINVVGNGVLSANGLIAKSNLISKGWTVAND